jgi:hypothetical protein
MDSPLEVSEMRRHFLFAIPLALCLGCDQGSSQARPAEPPAAGAAVAPSAAAASDALSGTVLETIDARQYTYLRLQTASGEVWAAVPKTEIAVGAEAQIVSAMWMENFKSATMNRTWPRIAFGVLAGPSAPQAAQPASRSAGMFAQAAMGTSAPVGTSAPMGKPAVAGSSAGPVVDAAISVPRATGKNARTIAEVYAQRGALQDQVVRVRGEVVKETDGVMGKNWIHLRDGTGKGALGDLAFASGDGSAVGETVVLSGVVHLNRDLGAGYHYDVLIEDVHVEKP